MALDPEQTGALLRVRKLRSNGGLDCRIMWGQKRKIDVELNIKNCEETNKRKASTKMIGGDVSVSPKPKMAKFNYDAEYQVIIDGSDPLPKNPNYKKTLASQFGRNRIKNLQAKIISPLNSPISSC